MFILCSRSTGDEKDEDQFRQSAPEIRDVFGDSDEEEEAGYEESETDGRWKCLYIINSLCLFKKNATFIMLTF